MSKITYENKVALNQNSSIPDINKVNDTDMNMIKNVVNNNETKVLLAVSSSAPATCDTGDIYFNTTDNLIYTATATNTWGATGVAPTENTIYIEFSNQTLYAYNGTTLISVGGGESLTVHNTYSTSTTEPYSSDYSNKAFGGTILWTNPNPTSNFSAQDITLSSDDYDCIEIVYEFTKNAGYRQIISTGKIPYSTNGGFMQAVTYGGDKGVIVGVRNISFTNKTTISIQNCNRYWTIGTEIGNDFCIPLYIIGYKTGLFPTQQSTRSLNTYSGDIEEKKDIVIDDGNK